MADVFISYSSKSVSLIEDMATMLETMGHTIWFDRHLSGGQDWWDKILERIRGATTLIVAIDHYSVKSLAVTRELEYALDLGIPVLPVVVDGELRQGDWPTRLRSLQFVDYRGHQREALAELAGALKKLPHPTLPDPLPKPPKSPIVDLDPIRAAISGEHELSQDVQESILGDLRDHVEDPEIGKTVQSLLHKLSARGDTTKRVDRKILSILETIDPEPDPSPAPRPPEPPEAPGDDGTKVPTRWDYTGYGAGAGFLLGILAGTFEAGILLAILGAGIGFLISFVAPTKQSVE